MLGRLGLQRRWLGLLLRLELWEWLGLGLRLGLGGHLGRGCSRKTRGAMEHCPAGAVLPECILQLEDDAKGDWPLAGGAARLRAGRRHGDAADRLPAAGQRARGSRGAQGAPVAAHIRAPLVGQRGDLVIARQGGAGEVVLGRSGGGVGKAGEEVGKKIPEVGNAGEGSKSMQKGREGGPSIPPSVPHPSPCQRPPAHPSCSLARGAAVGSVRRAVRRHPSLRDKGH